MSEHESVEALNAIRRRTLRKYVLASAVTMAVLVIAFFVALKTGPVFISFDKLIALLLGNGDTAEVHIIRNIRLPRILCCAIVGAALSVAGVAMQGLFRNPMASPSVLGVSSGAAFGAALAMGFGIGSIFGSYSVPMMAFVFCIITTFFVYFLARTGAGVSVTMLLLAGIAVGAFFNGLVSAIQYIVDDNVLPGIVYWLMGSFSSCGWNSFGLAILPILTGIAVIAFCANELNIISLGEEQAENLGVNVKMTRILLLIGTSLLVAGSVSISGIIGFVGLIIPHTFRMIVGPNHKILIPLSIIGGAAFMIFMDAVSRWIISPDELPIGILTALLGAPFFIYVMRTKRKYNMGGD
ncbi:MAG: iron ABC transporter permease [Candidatus Methanomethylophilaceae archaeon]